MKYDTYKDGDNTICSCKVNGQTIRMIIYKDSYEEADYYSVCLFINKRSKGYQHGFQTGKIGLIGLLIAKQMLLDFIDELKNLPIDEKGNRKNHNVMLIFWDDNRRRDVYYRSLKKYGFKFSEFEKHKCLRLNIN